MLQWVTEWRRCFSDQSVATSTKLSCHLNVQKQGDIINCVYHPNGGTLLFDSKKSVNPDRSSLGATGLHVAVYLEQHHVTHTHTHSAASKDKVGWVVSLRGLSTLIMRLVLVPLVASHCSVVASSRSCGRHEGINCASRSQLWFSSFKNKKWHFAGGLTWLRVSVLQWLVFAPQAFPYQCLGLFGTFCKHLVENYAGLMYKGWVSLTLLLAYFRRSLFILDGW